MRGGYGLFYEGFFSGGFTSFMAIVLKFFFYSGLRSFILLRFSLLTGFYYTCCV
jgi:hypothetical protein